MDINVYCFGIYPPNVLSELEKEITLQLSDDQLDNLRGVFNHFGWDLDSVIVNENNSSVDAETQTDT